MKPEDVRRLFGEPLLPAAEDELRKEIARREGFTEPLGAEQAKAVEDIARVLRPERRVGRYLLREPLGEGGMAVVYRAADPELRRDVALKLLKTVHVLSPGQVERFQREGRHAARLRHPNIVTIHDVGRDGDVLYTAMELVEGKSFEKAEGALPEKVARLERVARAVHYAHEQGILHRDLKPQNVMVDAAGSPRVLDFGLSRDTGAESGLTKSGAIFGSPHYMTPEQARGRVDEIDVRTDVYALGAMLYESLAGRVPFPGDSLPEVLQRVTSERPSTPPGPPALAAAALRALEKDPARRYPSAAAFADDLARFLAVGDTKAGEARRRRRGILLVAAGVVVGAAAALWPRPPEIPGLVARWTFDGDARDVEGALHGRPHGAARIEQGELRLGAEGGYVEVAHDARLSARSFTIAAWTRPEKTGETIVVDKRWQPGKGGYVLRLNNDAFPLYVAFIAQDGRRERHAFGGVVPEGAWAHVAAAFDGASRSVVLYVNGEEAARQRDLPDPAEDPNAGPLRIGDMSMPGRVPSPVRFQGGIDDVRFYDRALSAEEIRRVARR